MNATTEFQEDPAIRPDDGPTDEERLFVDLEGYEGPIDVLLALAREQKVDITRISILALADQYIAFIAQARRVRLEIAADYLVMAAWLAYLKSRLLLPTPTEDKAEPTAADMAAALAFQLQRLQAMQDAGARLMARPQLGKDVFLRGAPEGLKVVTSTVYTASLYELLKAYGDQRGRKQHSTLRIMPTELYSMEAALERLSSILGRLPDWTTLQSFIPQELRGGIVARSALAAMFTASLELVRSGKLQLRQDRSFGQIYIRKAPENPVTELPVPERQIQ
ncbi:MAG TPA: ScpA family protein [Alphaproteobacteria bacterium]|nr:ScpA family protein [Alphaproteobacteria bacterium]